MTRFARWLKTRPARTPALRVELLERRDTPTVTALGAGPGGGPRVQVYADDLLVADFLAYDSAFRGGVNVEVGDVNGDGFADVVTAPGPGGGPNVKVFLGTGFRSDNAFSGGPVLTGIDPAPAASFYAYDPGFLGGVNLAVGNVDPTNDLPVPPLSVFGQLR